MMDKYEDTAVIRRNRCLESYMLLNEWPPKLPPLVRVCNRWVNDAFKVLKEFGKAMVINDGDRRYEAVFFATWDYKPVSMWLISTYAVPPSKELFREFLLYSPSTLSALFDDLLKLSKRDDSDVAISPKLYPKVAYIIKDILELHYVL
jgi:hypothetical protein